MLVILQAIIPIALLALIGVLLVKWNFVSSNFFSELSKVVFKVFVPVFLFTKVYRSGLQDVSLTLFAYFVPVLLMFIIVAFISNHRLALSATFSNNVLIGIPVIMALAGEQGLAISLAIISFHSLILFSAFYLFSSKKNITSSRFKEVLNIFSNPVIIGLLLGLVFNYASIQIPEILMQPLDMLAGAALPLALIILGSSLAQIEGLERASLKKTLLLCTSKLILLPLMVYIFSSEILLLDSTQVLCLLILAACPTGISVMPFVQPVKVDRQVSHSTVALSSILSIFSLPLTIWLLGLSL